MAMWNFLQFAVTFFLATSSAAPSHDLDTIIQIPDQCKDGGFCSVKPDGYKNLEDQINSVLPKYLRQDYGDREGPDTTSSWELSPESDWHNCPYITQTESMYMYRDGSNVTKTDIIVQTKLFRQEITTIRCAREHINTGDEECFSDFGLNAFGMKSACKTTYVQRTLYVYDIEKKEVVPKNYPIPVCCSCVIYDSI